MLVVRILRSNGQLFADAVDHHIGDVVRSILQAIKLLDPAKDALTADAVRIVKSTSRRLSRALSVKIASMHLPI
jgi:light-regulated signal transduction histidine kinase (bacteriophytochrome)